MDKISINDSWSMLRDAYIEHLKDCIVVKMREDSELTYDDALDECIDELDEDLHAIIPYDLCEDDVNECL